MNSVGAGPIETSIYDKTALSPEEARKHVERVKSIASLGHFGTADAVASVVAFLASAEARYVTGSDFAA